MFAYHRSTSHSTVIQRILTGSLTGTGHDVVLVKPTCLELRQLNTSDVIDDLLTLSFEQPSFGNITDANVVRCRFLEQEKREQEQDQEDEEDEDETEDMASISIDFPYVVKVRQGHTPVQGDDVIVVISEYGKLVFMTIATPQEGHLSQKGRFEPLAEICMDEPGLEFSKVNKRLAVDPYSRAIAISAYEDRFDVMIMGESISRTHFDPIVGRGSIEEEGIIWHMEFLHTESNSRDRILLALMIFNDVEVKCWISIYAIDATNPEDVLVERIGRLPLDANAPIPILFIPLKHHPEAFVIITNYEAALVTVEDIVSGNMFYPTCLIPRPFGEVNCPLMTSFAIPVDDSPIPYVYVGSDNGNFFKLSFPSPQAMNWDIMERINPVGSSMCVLGVMDVPENEGEYQADIVIYAGEGADSQVLAVDREHKRPPLLIQSFENRAPITDMRAAMSADECGQDTVVSCSGQGGQGALCLFQRGIKSKTIGSSSNHWQQISRVWSTVISDADNSLLPLLVTSSAINSKVLSTRHGDIRELEQLQADKRLVGAGSINLDSKGYLIKAYPDEVVVIDITAQDLICARWKSSGNETITLAAVLSCANPGSAQIALVVFNDGESSLIILTPKPAFDHRGIIIEATSRSSCQAEPSYLGYLQLKNQTLLAIGTFKPSVQFYDTSSRNLELLEDIDLAMIQGLDNCAIPHSMAVITSEKEEEQSILMLGLRVGSIVFFPIEHQDKHLFDKKSTPFIRQLGRRAVRFDSASSSSSSLSSILALSDQLWRVQYNDLYPDAVEIDLVLLPWMKDIEQVVSFSIDGMHREFTGVVADDSLHVVQLSKQSTVAAEKIPLGETPTRFMLDSAFSHNAFVLTSAIDSNNFRNKNTLHLVDTRSSPSNQNQILLNERAFQPTDEVLCMTEWTLQHRNKTYRYLCLGVGQMNMTSNRTRIKKIGAERGTLMIYRLKQGKDERVRYTLRPVMNKDLTGGVFAICPHPAGLLFSAGPVLYLYQLDTDGKEAKLIEITKKPLRFLITGIQVDGDKICVTCQGDSISYYRFNAETSKLEYCKSDISARTMLHSMMPHPQLVVGSNQFGGLIALWDNPEDRSFEQRLLTSFSFHYPDILIRPSLTSLLSSTTLEVVTHADCIDGHILPWDSSSSSSSSNETTTTTTIKPILCAGVSGGLISVHRVSQPLYELLYALQERLVHFAQSLYILLGSPRDFQWYHNIGQREKHALDGDLLSLYLRLESDEQHQVVELVDDQLFSSILDPAKVFLDQNTTSTQIASLLENLLRALERCC